MNRLTFAKAAQFGASEYGGVNTILGAGAALNSLRDQGGGIPDARGALIGAGFDKEWIIENAPRSWEKADRLTESYPLQDKNLALMLAATARVSDSARAYAEAPVGDIHKRKEEVAADLSVLQAFVKQYRSVHSGGVTLQGPHLQFAQDYFNNPDAVGMNALNALHRLSGTQTWSHLSVQEQRDFAPLINQLPGLTSERAGRIKDWIRNEGAKNMEINTHALLADHTNYEAMRDARRAAVKVQDIEGFNSGKAIDILHAPDPAAGNAPPNYPSRMSQLPLGNVPLWP